MQKLKKIKNKKNHGSRITVLIFSNEGMIYLMKIVKPLENWRLAVKEISEKVKNKAKRRNIRNVIRNISC